MKRIVIVGAGLSGLTAALACLREARARGQGIELTLLEASPRAGGHLGTAAIDGFLVERGADGFLAEKKHATTLATTLGIEHRLIRTQPGPGGASVVHQGRLVPIPEGFSLLAPTRFRPMLRTPLLTWRGKARLALELLQPRGPAREDESLASFVRRRMGPEVLDKLAQPLAGGIYGADPERLSLRATLPRFLDAEQASRSVILGLRRRARGADQTQGARYGLFASFDHGMQVLIDALVTALPGSSLQTGVGLQRLELTTGGVRGTTTRGDVLHADAAILAISAAAARPLFTVNDAALADALGTIEHGSAATVTFGFDRTAFPTPLPGYGFVVPTVERRAALAATFASRKWSGRAPPGSELVRVFLGGPTSPTITTASDQDLIAAARAELTALLGVTKEPRLVVVQRYQDAMPQYQVGHLQRVTEIEGRLAAHPRVRLTGNSLRGVGIPDTIATSERTVRALFNETFSS